MKPQSEQEIDELAETLRVLGHTQRLRIVIQLTNGEFSVGEIEQHCDIRQPGLSQQLGILRKAGLVETRRDGKLVYYRLDTARIAAICSALGFLQAAKDSATGDAGRSERQRKFGSGASFAKVI